LAHNLAVLHVAALHCACQGNEKFSCCLFITSRTCLAVYGAFLNQTELLRASYTKLAIKTVSVRAARRDMAIPKIGVASCCSDLYYRIRAPVWLRQPL